MKKRIARPPLEELQNDVRVILREVVAYALQLEQDLRDEQMRQIPWDGSIAHGSDW